MALLLAPYNNGMRLGQGFNSYTQQICIDDAVVVDPDRIENSVTNDGFTMRDLRLASGAGVDPNAGEDDHGNDESEDGVVIPVQESTEDVSGVTLTSGTTFAARSLMYQVEHRALSIRKLLEDVTSLENDLEDSQDLDPVAKKQKMELLEKKRIRLTKLKAQEASTTFPLLNAKSATKAGRSQVVTYTSRFVSKLSEVTDDMNISGSLSIKYGTIGGSGKGSFVDSNKFKESDLNFFISVKVINQSINIKDASVFQSLPSVNESKFTEVFGDCFISGFLEGGEFNALVSMKVLNQEQRTDITAKAKVALTVGAAEINAKAQLETAKASIKANTETTIQVGWSGGGQVKKPEEEWTVESLMKAAAAFPNQVSRTPQRTYAILTKYDSLRSFWALKPVNLIPIVYENAAIYTNTLLDAYMDFKNIYRNISSDLFDLQAGTKNFNKIILEEPFSTTKTLSKIDDESKFSPDYKGLDLARRACRFQMIKIVSEVDAVTKDPKLATDETRGEQFQSPVAFRERLPKISLARPSRKVAPLGDDEKLPQLLEGSRELLNDDEKAKVEDLEAEREDIGKNLRLAPLLGSREGSLFCNLDFLKPTFSLLQVTVEVYNGLITGLTSRYSNGLVVTLGSLGSGKQLTLDLHPEDGEKIIACSIEAGHPADAESPVDRITAIRLYTNRGPDLIGQADDWTASSNGKGKRGGVNFEGLTLRHYDPLLIDGHVKGFWGRSVDTSMRNKLTGLYQLAPIWGDIMNQSKGLTSPRNDSSLMKPKSGTILSRNLQWSTEPHTRRTKTVEFGESLPSIPTVLHGFRCIDIAKPCGPTVHIDTGNITKQSFDLVLGGWDATVCSLDASWLTLPDNNINFQSGILDTEELNGRLPTQNAAFRVHFATSYKTPPKVACWFTLINQPNGWRSLKCTATNITTNACTINVETWANREFKSARVQWLAWDSECDGKNIRSGQQRFNPKDGLVEKAWYNGSFQREPQVFAAFNLLDFSAENGNLRMFADVTATKDKLIINAGTWADTVMSALDVLWIAVE